MINKRILFLSLIFFIVGTFAIGEIYFSNPTPNNNTRINTNSIFINLTVNTTGEVYSFIDFDNSLVGWWRGENTGKDELGKNNGTLHADTTYASGKFNQSFTFDGTGDYIDINCTSNNLPTGTIPFSIFLWINTSSTNTAIFDLGDSLGGQPNRAIQCSVDGTGKLSCTLPNIAGPTSLASINNGNWHQVGVINNGTGNVSLYIDGSQDGSAEISPNIICGTPGLTIGVNHQESTPGGNYFNGKIDEFIIFNRSLSTSEIQSLYNTTASQYLNNFTNLASGNHTFIGYFTNSSGNKNQTATRTIIVDIEVPVISNIFFYPNDTDSLDPLANITFNATITDNSAVNLAILEIYNGTRWKNFSMSNSSSVYNVTLTLDSIETNYTYQIWTNDSVGNPSQSTNRTFSALWDCTWNATSDLGAIAGFNQNKQIGNITINNTGDILYSNNNCSLDFRITYNLQEGRIYYDNEYIKNLNSYTISAKGNRNISINATFLSEIAQDNAIITLDEFRGRSDTRYRNTTLTLVSNQQGPYLYQKITTSSTSVSLTLGNFSLQGYIRNLMGSSTVNENNTAYNVTFFWGLPSGLTNVSGNLKINYTNITDSSLNYSNVNISFTDLASFTSGTKTIYLYAYGYNFTGSLINHSGGITLLTEQVNITFSCYNISDGIYVASCGSLDGDFVASSTSSSSGGGSGGGGAATGATTEPFSKFIKEDKNIEIIRGKQSEFIIEFSNPYIYGELQDITINLTGILPEYIDIAPKKINKIGNGNSINITVKISAPKYFEEGLYPLTIEINGYLFANNNKQTFTARKKITLGIFETSREDLIKEIEDAKILLKEIKSKNFSYKQMEDILNEIESLYEQNSLGKAHSKYLELKKIHNDAIETKSTIKKLNERILEAENNGISTPDTKRLVGLAEAAFSRGDYALALTRLKEAQLSYTSEVKGEFNTAYYIKNHPAQSAGFLIAIGLISLASTIITRRVLIDSKLKLLAEEEKLLIGLMKVVQRECFEEKRMSMEEYENTMSQYENRLNVVIQDKIESQTKLANLIKIGGGRKKVLKDEVIRLRELIKETQRDYFEKSKMETRIYQNMIKSYAAKLSEVEENLATIEAQEELRGRGLKLWKK